MNNNMIKCPGCGKENKVGTYMCMFCGCSLLAQNNMPQYTITTTPEEEKRDKISIVLLVISIVNMLTVAPAVFYFGILWLLFGGLSGDEVKSMNILCVCFSYISASIVALIVFIISKATRGRFLKTAIILVIIGAILGFVAPYLLFK